MTATPTTGTAIPTGQYIPPFWPPTTTLGGSMLIPTLLKVVAGWESTKGMFCVLEDGRTYQYHNAEWVAYVPPLTADQRMPR